MVDPLGFRLQMRRIQAFALPDAGVFECGEVAIVVVALVLMSWGDRKAAPASWGGSYDDENAGVIFANLANIVKVEKPVAAHICYLWWCFRFALR